MGLPRGSLFFGCKSEIKNKNNAVEEFGISAFYNDSVKVILNLNDFQNYRTLTKRIEEISCNESVPVIEFQKRVIYPMLNCPMKRHLEWSNYIFVFGDNYDFNLRNRFTVDSITKSLTAYYNDSLFLNENKKDLIFIPDYKQTSIQQFKDDLNLILNEYKKVTTENDIKLFFPHHIYLPPPPTDVYGKIETRYLFNMKFAEHNLLGGEVELLFNNDSVKLINRNSKLSGVELGEVIDVGIVRQHKSGKWIIAHNEEDINLEEIGGCTDGPFIIDFENAVVWFCYFFFPNASKSLKFSFNAFTKICKLL